MLILGKDALVAAAAAGQLPRETVDCPELGGAVIVQGMSGIQRDAWEKSLIIGRGKRRDVNTENIRARLVVRCLIDEAGARLFADGDAQMIGRIRVDVLNRIFEVAQRLSGVTDEDIVELKNASGAGAGIDSSSS